MLVLLIAVRIHTSTKYFINIKHINNAPSQLIIQGSPNYRRPSMDEALPLGKFHKSSQITVTFEPIMTFENLL